MEVEGGGLTLKSGGHDRQEQERSWDGPLLLSSPCSEVCAHRPCCAPSPGIPSCQPHPGSAAAGG